MSLFALFNNPQAQKKKKVYLNYFFFLLLSQNLTQILDTAEVVNKIAYLVSSSIPVA